VGGTFVVAFALVGAVVKPKRFAGLFSALPRRHADSEVAGSTRYDVENLDDYMEINRKRKGLKSVTLRDLIERKVEGLWRSLRGSKGHYQEDLRKAP
jgi:hypothetical protein